MKKNYRIIAIVLALGLGIFFAYRWFHRANHTWAAARPVQDRFTPLQPAQVQFQAGFLGPRVDANEKVRLTYLNEDELLEGFEHRLGRYQDWQGEHVGKFLHAATLAWNYSHDPKLKAKIDRVAARLIKTQEWDGYLGTYATSAHWQKWDVWVHGYVLIGLLTYYEYTHNKDALQACKQIGDLLIKTFGDSRGQEDINRAGFHNGMAATSILEPITLLYRATGDKRYLDFAHYIVDSYDAPQGAAILSTLEQVHSVRRISDAKAYEMLVNFNGLLELYRATGEKRLLDDMIVAWQDIVANRLYITGSASSCEDFQDDFHLPNDMKASICETCVTVTWEQMNLQLLRLTGEARFADELERSVYNHLLASQKPSGDSWNYYTPLEGKKVYGTTPSCCLSSGPRGVALIPMIAAMNSDDGGLVLNLYNSATIPAKLPSGSLTLTEQTRYPLEGDISLTVNPEKDGAHFPLRLRIPSWATGATVKVNGKDSVPCVAGKYAVLNRSWHKGDTVLLHIPLTARVVAGEHDNTGKAAILYGPLVLALDSGYPRQNVPLDTISLASDMAISLYLTPAPKQSRFGEAVFSTTGRIDGQSGTIPLYLTPFATAGQDDVSSYEIWIRRPGSSRDSGS